jgi:hypothetical protein
MWYLKHAISFQIDLLNEISSAVMLHLFQVQLLVSDSDVENYKQIKADIDDLRLLVEKSELWVYKSKSGGKKEKKEASGQPNSEVGSNLIYFLFPVCNCLRCVQMTCGTIGTIEFVLAFVTSVRS